MRWFTYARVSSEEQARLGFSLPSQLEACRMKAEELGAKEVVVFCDEGVPGDLLERPGLGRLREAVAQGGGSGLVVYDPDRLARNLSHQLLLTEEFERAGLRMEFVNFEWQQSPEGRLFYAIRGAIAEYEKEKIRERTVRGRRQKARMGGIPGHPHTYGYHFDPIDDTLSVIPEQAEVVRMIFRWVKEERIGPRAVASRLTEMGVPAIRSERWWSASIRRMLRNTTYIGLLYTMRYDTTGVHKNRFCPAKQRARVKERPPEEWIRVQVPALIDAQTWAAVQDYMENANRIWRAQGRSLHLLTGLAICGLCGGPISGSTSRGYRYYRCVGKTSRRSDGPPCHTCRRRAAEVEEQVWQAVTSWIQNPDSLRQLLQESYRPQVEASEAALAEVERALQNLVREKSRVATLFQKELLLEEEVTTRLGEIKERAAALQRRREELRREAARSTVVPELAFEAAVGRLCGSLTEMTDEQRRILLHWLVARVDFFGDRVVIFPRHPLLGPAHGP